MSEDDTKGTWVKGGKSPNPAGRKGGPDKDPVPAEMRRLMARLKKVSPQALEIMIAEMAKKMPDGTVVTDVKIAEKLIKLYMEITDKSESIKRRKAEAAAEQTIVEDEAPAFTLHVINPTTGNAVEVSKK